KDDQAVVAGDFVSYNGFARGSIAKVLTIGLLDRSFNPGGGANAAINGLVETPNHQFIIGGAFTSFDGNGCGYVPRLNSDGSFDSSFNAAADGRVRAVAAQS